MNFPRAKQLLLLVIAVLSTSLSAQGPNPPAESLTIELMPHPFISNSFMIEVEGNEGTWVHVMMHCYLPAGAQNDALIALYPWLAKQENPISALSDHYLPNQPPLNHFYEHLDELILEIGTSASHQDMVKNEFQVLPNAGGNRSGLDWVARPPSWIGNAASNEMRVSWVQRRTRQQDSEIPGDVFDIQNCARWALRKQAEDATLADDLWETHAATWLAPGGLQLSVQAIALVDDVTIQDPGPASAPNGLLNLPLVPKVQVSGAADIPVSGVTSNFTHDPGNPNNPIQDTSITMKAQEGGSLQLPLDGIIPPITLNIRVNSIDYTLLGKADEDLGHAIFPMPPQVTEGSTVELISVANSQWPALTLFPSYTPDLTVLAPAGPVPPPND